MTEKWLPISGYEGIYEVSDLGRIRSLARKNSIGSWLQERILKPRTVTGYKQVTLCFEGKEYQKKVHRLMLEAFIGPPPSGMECRHLDGNRKNNILKNLKWGTKSENYQDREQHGTSNQGERNGRTKLTDEDVRWIRQLGASRKKIAKCFNVSVSLINQIQNKVIWRHI